MSEEQIKGWFKYQRKKEKMSSKKLTEIVDDDISENSAEMAGSRFEAPISAETETSNPGGVTKEKQIKTNFEELEIVFNNDEVIQIAADANAGQKVNERLTSGHNVNKKLTSGQEKSVKNIQVIDLDDVPEETELTCSKAKGHLEKTRENNPNYSNSIRENSNSILNPKIQDLDDVPEDETELTCSKAKDPCRPPWKAPSKGTLTLHMKYFHEKSSSRMTQEEKTKNNLLEKTRENNNPNHSNSVTENSILNPKIQDSLADFETNEEIQIDDPRSINENEFQNQNNSTNIEIVKHEIFLEEENKTRDEKQYEKTRENDFTKNAVAGTGNDEHVLEENKTRVEITIDEKEIYGVIIHKNPNKITLGDLKKHMPISGSFRYFLQVGRIEGKDKFNQYEDDSNVLPLFRDNIIVKCKSIL